MRTASNTAHLEIRVDSHDGEATQGEVEGTNMWMAKQEMNDNFGSIGRQDFKMEWE